jgi:uracil phosphoribosyltransferase
MADIHRVLLESARRDADLIRNPASSSEEIRSALERLGATLARQIRALRPAAEPFSKPTPALAGLEPVAVGASLSVVVTTRSDAATFGRAMATALQPSAQGSMNFEGRRGLEALNTPVRDVVLPDLRGKAIDLLVVGKSILATGCTAISLTRTAMAAYMPRHVVIASIFYSVVGLNELSDAFPNSTILVVGDPAPLNSDGTLGIGLIKELM